MSLDKNGVAEGLLKGAGFIAESEPGWVVGLVPDFFCTGRADLWVEVKAVDEAARFQALTLRQQWLSDRAAKLTQTGVAFAWVDEEATEQHIKAAMALARDGLALQTAAKHVYTVVPHDADFSSRVRIVLQNRNGTELILAMRSRSGRYGRPQIAEELVGTDGASIFDDNGSHAADPFSLGLAQDDFAVGLELLPSDKPFTFSLVSLTGPAQRLTTVETVRRAAKKANSQFKNAPTFRSAASLLMVFEDGILVQEPLSFTSAFYGDLQFEFRGDRRMKFGPNGLWSETANRSTSGAALVRNNGTPLLVFNPWAAIPIPADVFPWPAVTVDDVGNVAFPD